MLIALGYFLPFFLGVFALIGIVGKEMEIWKLKDEIRALETELAHCKVVRELE
jgi:hypothetical protein